MSGLVSFFCTWKCIIYMYLVGHVGGKCFCGVCSGVVRDLVDLVDGPLIGV